MRGAGETMPLRSAGEGRSGAACAVVGEELTLEGVYAAEAEFVWRALLRFGVAPDVAEDLLHEVFLVVRRRLGDFERGRSLRGWLYGIARGVAANHRRGQSRAARREERVGEMAPERPPTPEDGVARSEAAALVMRFLVGLDPERRQVFELIEIEGLSGPEVAEVMQIPLMKVHTLLRSGRGLFRAAVAEHEAGRARKESTR